MEQTSDSQLKKTLLYGTILGFVLVIFSFILRLAGLDKNIWLGMLTYVFLITTIIIAIQCYRNRFSGGYISYGKALGTGVLTVLWASIIVAMYTYILTKYIDPGIIEKAQGMAMQQIEKSNNEDQIEMMSGIYKVLFTSGLMSIMTIIGNVFWGTIFSLIIAAFLKKDRDIFAENE